jgi:hypothetical protein
MNNDTNSELEAEEMAQVKAKDEVEVKVEVQATELSEDDIYKNVDVSNDAASLAAMTGEVVYDLAFRAPTPGYDPLMDNMEDDEIH